MSMKERSSVFSGMRYLSEFPVLLPVLFREGCLTGCIGIKATRATKWHSFQSLFVGCSDIQIFPFGEWHGSHAPFEGLARHLRTV